VGKAIRGYMMKKSFKTRVISLLKKENWQIENVTDSPIVDFIMTRGKRFRKACVIKSHGHLLKAEVETLQEYGQVHKLHVLYIHESEGHEIRFVRLYPRTERCTKEV
jgi:hypothetical protein